tara:strand:- start:16520 stop:18115 length:1596 start_codon:yes stop_codon:yes gene_type:complete
MNNLKELVNFIRVKKGQIQRYLKKIFDLLFSYLIIRLPLKNYYFKINLCSLEYLKALSDEKIKKIGLANDKGYLALKIIKNLKSDDKKMLEKIVWMISFERYEHFTINDFVKFLKKFDYKINDLKDFLNFMPYPFAVYGDYERFEFIMIWLRHRLDNKCHRKIGIYNESSIFTSIGHMTLLVSLLKAIDLKIIDKENTNLGFVITKTQIANIEYAKLLIDKCKNIDIEIARDLEKSYLDFEPNLELWPATFTNNYIFSRHLFGLVDGCWELKNSNKFLKLKKEHLKVAKDIFTKNYGYLPKDFVGMHFRIANDAKTARNTSRFSAKYALNILNKKGIKTILVGKKSNKRIYKSDSIYNFKQSENLIDTTKLKLSRYERECLQLYIWSEARFFIGSLSGGTMPPQTFGTPTIWLDTHPQAHVRLPSIHDHIIPKQVFYIKENRFLEFNELFEDKHIPSQSEDFLYLKNKGYKIVSCSEDKIHKSINDMIIKTSKENNEVIISDFKKQIYLNALENLFKNGKFLKFQFGAIYY